MKLHLLTLCVFFVAQLSYAQDSLQVTFSEEKDTLVKQRFIDRYENVFMTKVPTRHMFKVGLSQYAQAIAQPLRDDKIFNSHSLNLGYEFKFLPAFSLAVAAYMPYQFSTPLRSMWQLATLDAQLRWYAEMRKRIRQGRSANNFSGNYIALFYSVSTYMDNPTVGLKIGFQRRFLNRGFMDFAIAGHQDAAIFRYKSFVNWTFSSQVSFGLAFGDWKMADKAPRCDIFLCDEQIHSQWKIKVPEITVGYYLNRLRAGAAFEKRLGSWPASLNFQLDAAMNNGFNQIRYTHYDIYIGREFDYKQVYSREKILSFAIQPRYYLLTKRRQLRGRNTNGISGLYSGINTEYYYYKGKHSTIFPDDLRQEDNIINLGLLAGLQLRLFGHGYFDVNASYNFQDYLKSTKTDFGLRTNLTLGLAF